MKIYKINYDSFYTNIETFEMSEEVVKERLSNSSDVYFINKLKAKKEAIRYVSEIRDRYNDCIKELRGLK